MGGRDFSERNGIWWQERGSTSMQAQHSWTLLRFIAVCYNHCLSRVSIHRETILHLTLFVSHRNRNPTFCLPFWVSSSKCVLSTYYVSGIVTATGIKINKTWALPEMLREARRLGSVKYSDTWNLRLRQGCQEKGWRESQGAMLVQVLSGTSNRNSTHSSSSKGGIWWRKMEELMNSKVRETAESQKGGREQEQDWKIRRPFHSPRF